MITAPTTTKRRIYKPQGPTGTLVNITLGEYTRAHGEPVLTLHPDLRQDNVIFSYATISFNYIITRLDRPYMLLKPIPVIVEQIDESYVASFQDANIHASGETLDEAISNLKSYVTDVFDEFILLGEDRLGAGPLQEFAVLRTYMKKS